jgi:hypothetical protein
MALFFEKACDAQARRTTPNDADTRAFSSSRLYYRRFFKHRSDPLNIVSTTYRCNRTKAAQSVARVAINGAIGMPFFYEC